MTEARYPFTCCNWSTLPAEDRAMLVELVNAAGDHFVQQRSCNNASEVGDTTTTHTIEVGDTILEEERGAKQQRARERVRIRTKIRSK